MTSSGVQSIPEEHWIALDQALAWICFDEAFSLEDLNDRLRELGLELDEVRARYQAAWVDFAYSASRGAMTLRGRRERARKREQYVRLLNDDDLFNCRFLDFVLYPDGQTILLSRHDRDFSDVWAGMHNMNGWDFTDVVVRREDLLRFKRKARPRSIRQKSSRASTLAALEHARASIAGRPSTEIRRDAVMREMQERYGITRETARANWRALTKERPELSLPGTRKRASKESV